MKLPRWLLAAAPALAACSDPQIPAPTDRPLLSDTAAEAAPPDVIGDAAVDAPSLPDVVVRDDARGDTAVDAPLDAGAADASLDARRDVAIDLPFDLAAADLRSDAAPDVAPVDPLAGRGEVERLRTGFAFTEGPQWRAREGDLVFSDIPANTIYRLVAPSAFSTFRMPSDNSNGLAVDPMGRLLAAEHGSRSVTRTRPDGTRETLASHFVEGAMRRRLNSPNDLVVRSDGTVYFTDPPYGITTAQQELSFNGLFRVGPSGDLVAEWRGARSSRPNGVALSPDERVLYAADTAAGTVRAWDVAADGSLSGERVLVTTSGNPDGMAVDRAGNLFVTTRAGVEVFAPGGRRWGVITVPEQPANCAFGGADGRVLYITARTGLYSVRLAAPGLY